MNTESEKIMNKLVICKEEHDDDILQLVESKLEGCLDLGQLVLIHDKNDKTIIESMKGLAGNKNLILIGYDSSSTDEELNSLLKEKLGDSKIYWLKGNGIVFNRASTLYKFLILKDESLDTYINPPQQKQGTTPLPKFIGITLTNKCNYKCFFCNRESNDKYGTIELEHFYSMKSLIQNAEILNLTGWGEPFSYKNIKEVLKFINDNNDKNCISLTSNGSLLTEEIAELLSKNLHQLIISINAATKVTYERDMRNGRWEKVLNNIRNARKYIPRDKIHFVFVGHRDNIHEFPEFVKLASELDVWQVELLHLQVTKLEHIKKSLWFHKEITNKYIDEANILGKQLNVNVQARKFDNDYENKINKFDCTAPFDQAYISESGNVAPCCYSGMQNMGNIHFHNGFENIWNNRKYYRLRKEKYFPECETCGNANSLNNLMTSINVLLVNDPRVYEQLPLVSVVVPSYNQAEWLPKTLDSLVAQSYPVWEAVVVDDGSTDNTWKVIQEYSKKDSRIKGVHKENGGISSALNAGIENAKGKYFCWLSSDDLFYPDKLEHQIKAYEKLDESYGIVFGAFDLIDDKEKVNNLTLSKPFIDGLEFPQQLKYDMIDGCTVMLPMNVMREMGGFNTQFKHAQDTEFWFRLAAKGYKFYYIDKKLVKRRIHQAQGFTDYQLDCRYDGYAIVHFYLSKYSFRDFYKNIDWLNEESLKNFMHHFFDMVTNDGCHINHDVLNDQFWNWFINGLETLDKPTRKIILNNGIDIFRKKRTEGKLFEKYLRRFESTLETIGGKQQKSFTPNNNFEDITKFDRSTEKNYSSALYEFGIKVEKNNDIGTAASVFKYLADYPNPYTEKSFPKFVDWCFTYEEYQKFIKSFRRKGKLTQFDDDTKLLYLWAKLSINSKDGLTEIIESISDNSKKEKALAWHAGNYERTKVEDIHIWNYQVIPYKVEHYLKVKCNNCNTDLSRKISFNLEKEESTQNYLCTNCFTGYELNDGLLKEYFKLKFISAKTNGAMLNRPPKVAFVMRYTDIMGGGVKVAYKHMQWLADLGCEITIYSDAPKPEWISLPGKFIRVKDHYEINNINADTVIVFSIYDVPKILTKVDHGKVYHICQGYEGYHIGRDYDEMRSDKYFYTTLHSFKVGNILVSNHLMKMFEEKFGRKGHYIPNAIDLNTYFPNPKIRKESNSILFIGNPNDPLKGFKFLNDALSKLQSSSERFEHINLYIVWGGTKLNGEEKQKEIAGIKIHYLTGLSGYDVANLMNRVSLVVNCSWYEGFTLPVLEAMACGTPTITTSNMGAESFCVNGKNSIIVNYADNNMLIEGIKDVLLNRIDINSIIKKGFETALEYSGWNGAVKFVNEYSNILHYKFEKNKVDNLLNKFIIDVELLKSRLERKLKLISLSGKPVVSIILVTYNQIKYTLECINSIREFMKIPYEIIVVDNASIDETVHEIEKQDDIILIKNDYNLGFPVAVNQAIKAAQGKNILLLNNDIVVTAGWIERMLEMISSDEKIGIVGPVSNIVSGVQLDKNAKYNSIEEMHKYAAKVKKENAGKFFEFPRVAFLCTLIKREVIEKIGGLDERFSPGNFEDDDFCLRAQLAGYKTVIAQDVFIHHYGSKSFKANGTEEYAKRLEHNKQVFIDKWGADPEEIWLKGKSFTKRNPVIPIDINHFVESMKRAMIYLSDKDFQQALINLEEAIEGFDKYSKPGFEQLELIDLLDLAGNASLMNGDLEKSQQYFEKELELNPTSSRACAGLAEVFFTAEMFEESKTMFEWSLKHNPENVNAQKGLKKVNEILQLEEEHNTLESKN